MVRKYKTKPCVIEAIQWTGDNEMEILKWSEGMTEWNKKDGLYIDTLEGRMRANIGDYIIRGLKGEYYPCKPDVFSKKYEEVMEDGK